LPRDVLLDGGDNAVQLLGVTVPSKFGRAKNVPNLVRFTTTFKFERKYFWSRWR